MPVHVETGRVWWSWGGGGGRGGGGDSNKINSTTNMLAKHELNNSNLKNKSVADPY